MKKNILWFSFLIMSLVGFGQSINYYPGKLMLKLNTQAQQKLVNGTIQNSELDQLLASVSNAHLYRVFPNHATPLETTNSQGNALVDLSTWYSLEYYETMPVAKLISDLKNTQLFEVVEQRSINQLLSTPNDPLIANQYYLKNIDAFRAWDVETGDTNVVVGITDTGIDKIHPDLIKAIKYNYYDPIDGLDNDNDGFIDNHCGWDVGNNDNNVQWNYLGHGTFVSGFVSAVPNNNIGIAGVGYYSKVLPVKVDNSLGILIKDYEGIVYAVDHGASIVNCSWGSPGAEQFGRDIINYATHNKGALVIAACGNSNSDVPFFPASYEHVLSVAATDSNDYRWSGSSYGPMVDISAPGEFVYSTWINGGYSSSDGTSFSAPIVAGVAALLKAHFPHYSNLQIAEQIRVTADNIDTIPANATFAGLLGSGRVNAYKALTDTTKPGFRFTNVDVLRRNDTVFLSGDFINYLYASSPNAMAQVTYSSNYLSAINANFSLGSVATLGQIDNHALPFSFRILPNAPIDLEIDLKITYSDTNYQGFEYYTINLNTAIGHLDTNMIATTVNSYSTIGFTDESKEYGEGLSYRNGRNMLAMSGLILATASNKVSDNIYSVGGNDQDFTPLSTTQSVDPARDGDQMLFSKYDDSQAGFSKLGVEISQYSFAFNQSPLDKVVFINYQVVNKGNTSISNLHLGLYADWDIGYSSQNIALYDASLQLAYTYPSVGAPFAGIQLISNEVANCYNFDNDGSGGSVNIYDGFLSSEKWQALTQNRLSAGSPFSDVSSLLSCGPYNIAVNDTLDLMFALLAGDYESDIKASALAAKDWFNNTASISNLSSDMGMQLFQNYPNPATKTTQINFSLSTSEYIRLEILDANGRLIKVLVEGKKAAGTHANTLNLEDMDAGVYYYRLSNKTHSVSRSFVVGSIRR
jgi:subtilisin family serine protease